MGEEAVDRVCEQDAPAELSLDLNSSESSSPPVDVKWPDTFDEARTFFLAFRADAAKVPRCMQSFRAAEHGTAWKLDASAASSPASGKGTPSSKDRGGFFGTKMK